MHSNRLPRPLRYAGDGGEGVRGRNLPPQTLNYVLVYTFPFTFSAEVYVSMHILWKANGEPTRERFVGSLSSFLAKLEIILN